MKTGIWGIVPSRKEIVPITWISAIVFLILLLGKGSQFTSIPLEKYLRELAFLVISLFATTRALHSFHRFTLRDERLAKALNWRVSSEILFVILISPLITLMCFSLLFPKYLWQERDWRIPVFVAMISLLIQFIYLYYFHFADAQNNFRKAEITRERLRYEKITAQYKAMQSHVSPHFIYNCLGSMDHLIRKSPEDASRIVHSLSRCLQHILVTMDRKTITLEEELNFISKYDHLLQVRFPGSTSLSVFIDHIHYRKHIPPCILQMMVENAVKHNYFDKSNKLNIVISVLDTDRLSVSNNCNKKTFRPSSLRTGTGLHYIRQRYLLLTDEPVSVQQNDDLFTANLPLLNL